MRKIILLSLSLSLYFAGHAIVLGNVYNTLTVDETVPGTLSTLASDYLTTVTNLTLTGTIDARDFVTMRDGMPLLAVVDLSGVTIAAYAGTEGTSGTTSISYPANTLPDNSFYFKSSNTCKSSITSLILPSNLTAIGSFAIACDNLTALTIPSRVTTIGKAAFLASSSLTSITIPASVVTVGDQAFIYCLGLTTLTIVSSATTFNVYAFYFCNALKTINCLDVKPPTIAYGSFLGITTVTDVFVPTNAAVSAYKANTIWYGYFPGNIIKTNVATSQAEYAGQRTTVFATPQGIVVDGTRAGEKVSLYNLQGVELQHIQSTGVRLVLPATRTGIYLVKTASGTVKVIL